MSNELVDAYISAQPELIRPKLQLIRRTISKLVPDAEEVMSYGIPAFRYHGLLAHYAGFKSHYSFFFGPEVTKAFLKELSDYETSKATIKIPADKPVPVQLLTRLTRYAKKNNEEKARQKLLKKKAVR
jgi:uncharacterized protein YdhG (YjbR/CyaY superfamily)